MLTLILPITTEDGFKNLKKSLEKILPTIQTDTYLLCLTNQAELYPKCRNLLPEVFDGLETPAGHKYLTIYIENQDTNLLLEAKKYLDEKSGYTFLYNENIILPPDTISNLMNLYSYHPNAGFVSGHFAEYPITYNFKDIYDVTSDRIKWDEIDLTDRIRVDTTIPYGMLTKTKSFVDLFTVKQDALASLAYGLNLRRAGYENYIDTNLKYFYGEKYV